MEYWINFIIGLTNTPMGSNSPHSELIYHDDTVYED